MKSVLVTGGAGYVGSHVMVALASTGRHCVCVDNYANSSAAAVARVQRLTPPGSVTAYELDVRDLDGLRTVLERHPIDSVVHLAALKAVGESVGSPALYRDNNVGGTRTLLEALRPAGVRKLVFSSSATVYGMANTMPLDELASTSPQNPYGEGKLEVEHMLHSLARSDPAWKVASLRYFNPAGADPSGLIGEDPRGVPSNLMPYVCQVAAGWLDRLVVWGSDYPTRDGTGVRDFIHVTDLAEGHIAALDAIGQARADAPLTLNLGTGRGHTVLELVETFERVNGVSVPREFGPRRPGDVAECYADVALAARVLGWRARRGLEDICRDAWRWQLSLGNARADVDD